jgi:hypothetical protein
MKTRLLVAAVLIVAAASLARALVTHDGVGPFEYAVSALLIVLLLGTALTTARHRRRA